jgi:small subunit ribosomal protein S6
LFIFGETVQEERVKELAAYVIGEIEKAGGKITESRDLGRRTFARPLQKKESGFYLSVTFQIAGDKIATLTARYKLNDEVFRCQITRLDEKFLQKAPAPAA